MVIEVSATLVANITRRRPGFFDAFWLNLNFLEPQKNNQIVHLIIKLLSNARTLTGSNTRICCWGESEAYSGRTWFLRINF